jgi:hypothetical protein
VTAQRVIAAALKALILAWWVYAMWVGVHGIVLP